MTSTTLQHNRKVSPFASMYKWTLKKNIVLTIVYTVILFTSFSLPMIWFTTMSILDHSTEDISSLAYYAFPVASVVVAIFSIVFGTVVFNFLHNKRSVDLYNAFPLSRKDMFFSKYLAGLTLATLPILISTPAGICTATLMSPEYLEVMFTSMLITMLVAVATYSFTVFMSACVGKTSDAVVLTMGLGGAFPFFVLVLNYMIQMLTPGINSIEATPKLIYALLSPEIITIFTTYIFDFQNNGFTSELVIFLLYFVLFTSVSVFAGFSVYKRRKMECAQTQSSFKLPERVIRVIVTLSAGTILAAFFTMFTQDDYDPTFSHIWFWVGMIFGTIIAHFVLEVILSKGFKRIKKNLPIYFISLGLGIIVYIALATGCFGRYAYVPDNSKIDSVEIEFGTFCVNDYSDTYDMLGNPMQDFKTIDDKITDEKLIAEITDFHQEVVNNIENQGLQFSPADENYYYDGVYPYNEVTIKYNLKNGTTLDRQYTWYYFRYSKIQEKLKNLMSDYNLIEFKLESSLSRLENLTVNKNGRPRCELYGYDVNKGLLPDWCKENLDEYGCLSTPFSASYDDIEKLFDVFLNEAKNDKDISKNLGTTVFLDGYYNCINLTISYQYYCLSVYIPVGYENTLDYMGNLYKNRG